MTQEEKAKAYDNVREKIVVRFGSNVANEIFSEYEEPDDERIRKDLILYLKSILSNKKYGDKFIEDWIAWLEKQGEQPKKHDVCDYCDQQGSCVSPCPMKLVEKQGEQKPANWFQELKDKLANATPQQLAEWKEKYFKEEPVSEPNKELAETYLAVFNKKFPILPSLSGKQLADYKNFLNKCQQIFGLKEWGIRPIQSKLFEKLSLLWAAWGAEHLQEVGMQDEKEQDIHTSLPL